MITEKATIKCEAIFSEDRLHRLLWRRVWDKDKACACVIMLNPCNADNIVADTTTSLVVNNIARLGDYGGVVVVNLFTLLTPKLNFQRMDQQLNDYSNDIYIKKAAEECETIILAWGKSVNTNAKIYHRAEQVLALLKPFKEKLRIISDGVREGIHPLTPTVRSSWTLTNIDAWLVDTKEKAMAREEKEKLSAITTEMDEEDDTASDT